MTTQDHLPAAVPATSKPLVAAAWMMGAVASFTSMAVAGREVAVQLDTFEVLAWRSLFGVAIMAAVIALRGRRDAFALRAPQLHFGRNIVHFTAQNLWFYAITVIPLSSAPGFAETPRTAY